MRRSLQALRQFCATNADIPVYGALRSTNYVVPLLCLIGLGKEEYVWVEDLIARTSALMPLFLLGLPTIVSLTYSNKGLPHWMSTYQLLSSALLFFLGGLVLLIPVEIPIEYLLALFLSRFFVVGAKYKVMGKYLTGVALETTLYFVLAVVLFGRILGMSIFGDFSDLLVYLLFALSTGLLQYDIRKVGDWHALRERAMDLVDDVLSTGLWNLALSFVVVNLVLFLKTQIINIEDAEHDEIFLALRICLPTILFYQFLYNRGYEEVYGSLGRFHVKLFLKAVIFSFIPFALLLVISKSMTPSIEWYELLGIHTFHVLWVALGLCENACQHLAKQRSVVLLGLLLLVLLYSSSSIIALSFFQLLAFTNIGIALTSVYVIYLARKSSHS